MVPFQLCKFTILPSSLRDFLGVQSTIFILVIALISPPSFAPSLLFILISTTSPFLSDLQPLKRLLRPIAFLMLILGMINPNRSPQNDSSGQVIHRQIRTPLIFVLQPSKPSTFTRILVAREVEVYGFTVL